MGAMGQLRKDRFCRVERDLRAVEESETSSEQLERCRDKRWLKGFEESHWLREQTFLVGRLRD